ncbi:LuxR C-terminal-related transcriptional regulator [Nocardia anaemiae]|uniref:LuxR C-terminal-related transcriptional regulator n=1 Tax=Nocardia anaemiae TaxID=263910 RepID=UPI0007A50664|nr:LuxR C-terminal-related transcriptional regulator [Nocardia anaemiae]
MLNGPALDHLAASIVRMCRSGLSPDRLRDAVLARLRSAVPVDALWWSAVDPATLIFTRAYREELPAESGPYFVANEFLDTDVNKWTALARTPQGVDTMMHATDGRPARSSRYRDIFAPLGLRDELRAVLRVRGSCWGYMCLHREPAQDFSPEEALFVQRLAPYLGEGIRAGLLLEDCAFEDPADAPGLILLDLAGTVVGMNEAAPQWLDELGGAPDGSDLPIAVWALATRLRHLDLDTPELPRLRVRTRAGRWAVLHASLVGTDTTAVILEQAQPAEVAPVIMAAYGLTEQERKVTALVCQGLTTRRIAAQLYLTHDTVQDHLKSVFDRTGVHSRGELVATILQRDYVPRALAGDRIDRTGAFHSS